MFSLNILVVSDRSIDKSPTDFLVNAFVDKYKADVIYTKSISEKVNILDSILNRVAIELDKSNINYRLQSKLRNKRYDKVIILKGNRIYPWILRKIKIENPRLILMSWSGDNMCKWHNKSFFYHYGVNYYDVILSINIPDYKNIVNFCKKTIFFFDKRADYKLHRPMNPERKEFKFGVLFIGSYEKDRYDTLTFLAKNGVKIDIFGNMWDKCKERVHHNMRVHYKPLVGDDYVRAIFDSKISLGFLRKINNDTQTSRTFEIPSCGGFMLMERTKDHLRLFEEGREAEYFDDDKELLYKIIYYLKDNNKRELIAKNGRKRVVDSKYFFSNLADEIIREVDDADL